MTQADAWCHAFFLWSRGELDNRPYKARYINVCLLKIAKGSHFGSQLIQNSTFSYKLDATLFATQTLISKDKRRYINVSNLKYGAEGSWTPVLPSRY